MSGWRVGWMVGPEELISHVDNLAGSMIYGSPPFIQDAALFEREHVSVLSGEAFGPSGAGHIRISLAASEAELIEGCTRIARFVASLKEAADRP